MHNFSCLFFLQNCSTFVNLSQKHIMNNLKKALYLDDVRTPTQNIKDHEDWAIVRSYEEFVQWIENNGIPHYVSFDHDLADEHMADYFANQAQGNHTINYSRFKEKTGVDCLAYLLDSVHKKMEAGETSNLEIIGLHSHNPVGTNNMYAMVQSFQKHFKWSGHVFIYRPPFIIESTS